MGTQKMPHNPLELTSQELEKKHLMLQKIAKSYKISESITRMFWEAYQTSVAETQKEVSFFKVV